ncbi:VanW family protein [Sporosarcina ureae]|uniref:VanW family protein n=1 Tax=Sporosarcina ureae TaxID=1571 RepID=UPI0026ED8ABC|nr:VanW family protein [Sporosarcina ureae]
MIIKQYKTSLAFGVLLLIASVVFAQQAYAGDGFFSNFKKFNKHTYVGPFDISGHSKKEAKEKLLMDFSGLEQNMLVQLIVQDDQVDVPADIVSFDPDATLNQVKNGNDNSLVASASREGLRTVMKQNFNSLTFNEDEVEKIASQIEMQLQSGIMPQQVYIANFIPELYEQKQVIASAEYKVDGLAKGLRLLMEDLDGLEIQPNTSFSFREYLEGKESASATDLQMTIMASLLYKAALQTNWIMDERNISTELPLGVEPGFEAAINRKLNLDFIFTNPNQTVFTIRAKWTGSQLELSIEGLPFVHRYDTEVESITKYDPKTVIRYSAFVSAGAIEIVDKGKKGMEVAVKRNVMLNGSLEEIEDVSIDFYAPQPIIERHSLEKVVERVPDSNVDSNSGNADGNSSTNGSTDNPSNSANSSTGSSDGNSSNGNNSGSSTGSGSSSTGSGSFTGSGSGNNGSSSGNGSSNSNGSGGKDDVKYDYDKGGNLIEVDKNGNPID